jgi:hypothetical protein
MMARRERLAQAVTAQTVMAKCYSRATEGLANFVVKKLRGCHRGFMRA